MDNNTTNDNIPRLCYLEAGVMYFTDDIHNVCGDDWDDVPYEHNAGEPYERGEYSVEEINNGAIPWLYCNTAGPLYAGATRVECVAWLNKAHMVWGELELHEQ